jgi:hypothetical protein
LYPFLAAAYPAVAMLAANLGQVRASAVVRPLTVCLLVAAVLYALTWLLFRDPDRPAAITTWIILLLLSYGHVYDLLKGVETLGIRPGRHLLLFPAWSLLAAIGCLVIARHRPSRATGTALTVFMLAAVALPGIQILSYQMRTTADYARYSEGGPVQPIESAIPPLDRKPDIYYIILDGYARHDVMSTVFGYDNRDFREALEGLGFVIVPCSQSNYARTELSLASSLNWDYLQNLHSLPDPDSWDNTWIPPLIRDSRLRRYLETQGYQVIAFETGHPVTEIDDADVYLGPASSPEYHVPGISSFEEMFLRSTLVAFALDGASLLQDSPEVELSEGQTWHRDRILFALDSLEAVASRPGPNFVFAHVVAPHGPFVLGPHGESVRSPRRSAPRPEVLRAYADQARFVSSRITKALRVILSASGTAPVIILQADHGTDLSTPEVNMRILNAVLFPGAEDAVYSGLTPVNTLRVVLNQLTGGEMPYLEDVSYYSKTTPFNFIVVPPSCEE